MTNLDNKVNKLHFFLLCNNLFDYCDLVNVSEVCKTIIKEAEQDNLSAIGVLIHDIHEWSASYFVIDGYGNYSDVTNSHLNDIIDGILNSGEFEDEGEDE